MQFLRANTAVDVLIGPFVDDTDGKTAETALTIDVEVSKNGQALANKNDVTTPVHSGAGTVDGYYNCEFSTTDTNTEGCLVAVCFATGALPVRHEYMVLAEAAYDSLFTAKDTGYMDVNVKAISEDTTAANNMEAAFDGTGYGFTGCTIPTVTTLTGHTAQTGDTYALANGATGFAAIDTVVDSILVDTAEIGAAGAGLTALATQASVNTIDTNVDAILVDTGTTLNALILDIPTVAEFNARTLVAASYFDPAADTVANVTTVATLSGHTAQTGDTYALANGATGFAAIDTVVDAVKAKTDSLTFTVASQVDANAIAISGDTTSADNLELQYDGTGYTDDTAPASRSQVSGIGAAAGGALNFEVTSDNTGGAIKSITFVGAQTGTYTNTEAEDGVLHTIDDTANDFDIVYGFAVGGSRQAVEIIWKGHLDGGNDDAIIQVYDFVGAGWDTVASITGKAGTTNDTVTAALLARHTGTGADLGNVYVRIDGQGDDTNPQLNTDQLLVEAVTTNATIGYEGGAVWLDTAASNTNTENYVDGTADNPVSTIVAATTIAGNLNLKIIHLLPGSTITLAQAYDDYEFLGDHSTIALGGQSVSGATFKDATITGNDDNSNAIATIYERCDMSSNTLGSHILKGCRLTGDIVLAEGSDYFWDGCFSGVAGTGSPSVDLEAAAETKNLSIRHYSGGIELKNFGNTGTHTASVEGNGQVVLNANCSGGTLAVRGNFTITDNASGAVTLSDEARFRGGGGLEALGLATVTGTISDAGPVAGDFDGDSSLSATDDFYNGAFLVFTDGTYKGIGREISDYTGSSKNLVFSGTGADADAPFPAAPSNGDAFVIVGRIGTT